MRKYVGIWVLACIASLLLVWAAWAWPHSRPVEPARRAFFETYRHGSLDALKRVHDIGVHLPVRPFYSAHEVLHEFAKQGLGVRLSRGGTDLGARIKVVEDPSPHPLSAGEVDYIEGTMRSVARRESIHDSLSAPEVADATPRLVTLRSLDVRSDLVRRLQELGLGYGSALSVGQAFHPDAVVKEVKVASSVTLIRLFGGGSTPLGAWLFCCLDGGGVRADGLALPKSNDMTGLAEIIIPAGTVMLEGVVADQPEWSALGGNTQFYLPNKLAVPDAAYRTFRRNVTPDNRFYNEVIVDFGEKVVRFTPEPGVPER